MKGTILIFALPPGTTLAAHRRFRKRIYGEETSCGRGRYRYRRKGLLDGIPHVKLYTGVVIVRKEDARQVVAAVRDNGGECAHREVSLTRKDWKTLFKMPREPKFDS